MSSEVEIAPEELKISDVMTPNVITCKPDDTVVDAARKMAKYSIGSVVVVDDKGTILGILTEGDIVRRVVARGLDPSRTLVRDVMTTNPVTIYSDATLAAAAEYMKRKGIGHLPVVNEQGRLVGIITKTDIVRLAPSLIEVLYLRHRESMEETI
ncbi:CBS domain-containing protein [Hyperthermus butylicus]|uniref:Conserved archaeal protein n=1 Tax=Hyperthermus butylicus (strain DSM 5456 / JCM 9403 / PLM1-5) TaxID=415426 RepID=A2BLX1_HYPBU|nr:CBS domain-containing protein [Hyperthermus butylicus]ABM80982.1 conserved archaeal protein [Hyperthermus butylicus DSM 5456]